MCDSVEIIVEGIGNIGTFPKGANYNSEAHRVAAALGQRPGTRLNYTVISNGQRVGGGDLAF